MFYIIITKAKKRRVGQERDYRESVERGVGIKNDISCRMLRADMTELIEDGLGAAWVSTFVSPRREHPLQCGTGFSA